MTVLNIRNFDMSLLKALKVRAAQTGKTLRELVIAVLREVVK